MRHGAAVDPNVAGGDPPRWLTPDGRRTVREQAKRIVGLEAAPSVILASPLVRAMQTAELIASGTGFEGEVRVAQELHPSFGTTAGAVEALLSAHAPVVVGVGHEPTIRVLASHLAGRNLPVFRTSMVCCVRIEPDGSSHGEWLLDPTQKVPLIRLASSV